MFKIFKYELSVLEQQVIQLPKGARITRCEDVDGRFYLWAVVNTEEKEMENRYLEAYKTGAEFISHPDDLVHIGNCRLYIQMELMLYFYENIAKRGK